MTLQRLDGIRRTAWIVAACGREQWREHDLVRSHQQDEHSPHQEGELNSLTTRETPVTSSVRSVSNDAS
jgi:hypothetical protein